ncbi:MAG: hypothetical protein LBD30_06860, partial [Verrucomicrobiales bacterium]|nr:hypothetical protein [Verrucomicrobiales bacterium]
MKKIILALLLAGGAGSLSAAPVVVYDGSLTPGGMVLAGARIFTNSGKSWIYAPASVNAYTVVTGGGGYTTLNTGTGASGSPAEGVAAGFATLGGMALNSSSGYTLTVNLKTNGESHSGNPAADGPNRAGFSLTLIGSDRTKSIEIAFWRDQVWVQTGTANGETIFKHGESAAIDTASDFHEYNIVVQGDYYTIYNGQEFLLTGLLRDYSSSSAGFNGVAVYQTANFFFMGDNTTSAGGSYSFKNVLFDTDVNFYQLTGDGNQLSIHDALALPGVEYATALDHNATWLAQNGGTVSGSGNSVSNSGTNAAYGLLATGGQSVIVGADLLVRTTNSGTNLHGVVAEDFGSVALAGGTVTTAGDVSHGLFAGSGGLIAADGVTVTVGGADADAIFAQGGTVSGVNLTLNGGVRALAQGEVTLAGGSVIVSATAPAVTVSSGGAVTLQDVDLQAGGAAAELRGGTLTVSGGTLNVSGSQVFLVDASGGGALTVSNSASITNGADKILLTATNSGTFDFTISNADLGGDIVAKDAAVTVYLQNYAHLRGAIDPVDLDIQAGSRWTVTGNSTVGALANSGSVIFAGGATVKTLRAAGLSGAGAFVINVLDDLSAN